MDCLTMTGGFWVPAQGRNDGEWFDGLTMNGEFPEIFKVLGLLGTFWDIFWVGWG